MSRRIVPLILGAVALVLVVITIGHAWDRYDQPLWVRIPMQVAGLPFIADAVVLWVQRKGNYLGPFCLVLGTVVLDSRGNKGNAPHLGAVTSQPRVT